MEWLTVALDVLWEALASSVIFVITHYVDDWAKPYLALLCLLESH